eukprot:scaffold2710_cov72-Cylindrotheca_fusiformis.AAC.1
MDNDMNCASSAAECLAQYISYHCNNETDDRNRQQQQQQQNEDVMASWTLVLIGRLKQCHEAISAVLLQQAKPNNNNNNSTKQWYALAAPCLRALCKLIEMNELALEQMNSQKQTFLSTIFGLLQVSTTSHQAATLDPKVTEWVQDTAIYAARCIHSSLDDNLEMVELLSTSQQMMDAFPSFMTTTTTTTTVPNLAQLHVAGCIVSLYQSAPSSSSSSRRWLSTCIMNHVLPTLSRFMTTTVDIIVPKLRVLEENYRQARILWMTQKEDSELESSVLQSIQERKEPAREIARRLKQQQEQNPRMEKAVLRDNQEEDGRQAMENALTEWNDIIMPIQLALEVMANLLSCFIIEDDENDENETKMAVDCGTTTTNDDDDDDGKNLLCETLITNRVTECIVRMLQTLCLYKKTRHHEEAEAGNDELLLLKDDLDELISKVSACLSNCVLSKVFLVETADFIVATTWKDVLRQYPMERGVSSVMAAMVQQCPSLLSELIVEQDLELFQKMLRNTNDETIQRDAVCLMAAAMTTASTAASEQVVTKCTNEMIQCMSTSSLGVKCEILNAIMDLYGNDDFHPKVFLTLNMIHHFQQCLASIMLSSKDCNHLDPQEEEIMFNANRFVEYKLGR